MDPNTPRLIVPVPATLVGVPGRPHRVPRARPVSASIFGGAVYDSDVGISEQVTTPTVVPEGSPLVPSMIQQSAGYPAFIPGRMRVGSALPIGNENKDYTTVFTGDKTYRGVYGSSIFGGGVNGLGGEAVGSAWPGMYPTRTMTPVTPVRRTNYAAPQFRVPSPAPMLLRPTPMRGLGYDGQNPPPGWTPVPGELPGMFWVPVGPNVSTTGKQMQWLSGPGCDRNCDIAQIKKTEVYNAANRAQASQDAILQSNVMGAAGSAAAQIVRDAQAQAAAIVAKAAADAAALAAAKAAADGTADSIAKANAAAIKAKDAADAAAMAAQTANSHALLGGAASSRPLIIAAAIGVAAIGAVLFLKKKKPSAA